MKQYIQVYFVHEAGRPAVRNTCWLACDLRYVDKQSKFVDN